jgi:hypothetical protein
MKIVVEINHCRGCHHSTHSGGFTIRGARVICGHSDAMKVRKTKEEFVAEYPEYGSDYNVGDWKFYWYNRIVDNEIPDWCPLKNGSKF